MKRTHACDNKRNKKTRKKKQSNANILKNNSNSKKEKTSFAKIFLSSREKMSW